MEAVSDVLAYVRKRVGELKAGDWIEVRQIFITRLGAAIPHARNWMTPPRETQSSSPPDLTRL